MKKISSIIFLLGVMTFIFYMSSKNAIKSNAYNTELIKLLRTSFEIDLYKLFGNVYVDIIVRKLGHIFEFSLLSAAVYYVLSAFKFRWVTVLTIGFCTLLAFVDEFHQLYVSGRSSSVVDVIIDSIGVVITVSLISLLKAIKYEFVNKKDNYAVRNNRSSL